MNQSRFIALGAAVLGLVMVAHAWQAEERPNRRMPIVPDPGDTGSSDALASALLGASSGIRLAMEPFPVSDKVAIAFLSPSLLPGSSQVNVVVVSPDGSITCPVGFQAGTGNILMPANPCPGFQEQSGSGR